MQNKQEKQQILLSRSPFAEEFSKRSGESNVSPACFVTNTKANRTKISNLNRNPQVLPNISGQSSVYGEVVAKQTGQTTHSRPLDRSFDLPP